MVDYYTVISTLMVKIKYDDPWSFDVATIRSSVHWFDVWVSALRFELYHPVTAKSQQNRFFGMKWNVKYIDSFTTNK